MIGVGINEGVVIEKAEVVTEAEKVSLVFNFVDPKEPKAEGDAFDQLAGDGIVETGNASGTSLRMFPPLPPLPTTKAGANKTVEEMGEEAMDILGERKNSLIQILSCFTTTDKIKFSMFHGLSDSINRENLHTKIVDPAVIKQCFLNLANQFVDQVKPFLGKEDCALRLLLVRQSKTKHYATFRERFVKDNPFVEPALIPKEASKLKFTKYEVTQGLDNGNVVKQEDGDSTPVANSEPPAGIANMFTEK